MRPPDPECDEIVVPQPGAALDGKPLDSFSLHQIAHFKRPKR